MEITYIGTHDAVEIAATAQIATRDVPLEVEDELAKSLLEQDTWEAAKTVRKAKKDTTTPADDAGDQEA